MKIVWQILGAVLEWSGFILIFFLVAMFVVRSFSDIHLALFWWIFCPVLALTCIVGGRIVRNLGRERKIRRGFVPVPHQSKE